ncbi:MAG: DUF4013 domain-containing protein [Oscillochloris sp.]|nr:DUF4013 domain-containing protein [Oscillochloris sp.]
MDIGRAFSFVFEDEEWLTIILIGGLILLVPIFGQIVLIGFLFETARNVAAGQSRPLPRWNHLGETFSLGLPGVVIQIVYALPILLLFCIFGCLIIGGGAAAADESAATGLIGLTFVCLTPLIIVLSLALQPITLAAMVRHVQTGDLSAALRVGEVLALVRSNLAAWVVLWLLQILCGLVGSLGGIVFGIGALFTGVYAVAVFGHLMGQMIAGPQPQTREIY